MSNYEPYHHCPNCNNRCNIRAHECDTCGYEFSISTRKPKIFCLALAFVLAFTQLCSATSANLLITTSDLREGKHRDGESPFIRTERWLGRTSVCPIVFEPIDYGMRPSNSKGNNSSRKSSAQAGSATEHQLQQLQQLQARIQELQQQKAAVLARTGLPDPDLKPGLDFTDLAAHMAKGQFTLDHLVFATSYLLARYSEIEAVAWQKRGVLDTKNASKVRSLLKHTRRYLYQKRYGTDARTVEKLMNQIVFDRL